MGKKMNNSNLVNAHYNRSKKLILLDGREVSIDLFSTLKLCNHDNVPHVLHFEIFSPTSALYCALANTIASLLSTHSISHVSNILLAFRTWFNLDHSPIQEIKVVHLNTLQKVNPNYLAFIFPVLNKLAKAYPELFENEFIDFLINPIKWEQRQPAYFKLIANDPERGVLTSQELTNIHSALNLSFSQKRLSLYDYTLCWFFIATGVRPVQVSRLKIKDIQIINQDVMIKMPLAKAEGVINQGFMLRKAPSILADCLIKFLTTRKNKNPDDSVFELNPSLISKRIVDVFDSLDTYSARLEGQIPINSYRFRYTLATRAIVQGASDLEVARLLTHRSTSCIQFYRASLPDLQKPIQTALDKEMNFFAQAFKGKIISSLDEASIKNSVVYDFFHLHGKTLGSCGTHAKCHQNAPIACLTCPYFEPLISAPWKELLEHLLADQASESEIRIKEINQPAIDAIKEIISHPSVKEL